MKIEWKRPLQKNVGEVLREAGYHYFVDPNTHKGSFVLRMGRQYYPRYHVYVKEVPAEKGGGQIVDLHVDQKHASYEGQKMHSGESDGPLVEEEIARITRWLEHFAQV